MIESNEEADISQEVQQSVKEKNVCNTSTWEDVSISESSDRR